MRFKAGAAATTTTIALLTTASLILTPVYGWDADGHGAIGMTCMSGVKSSALTSLKRLLGGKDIVDISPWSFQLIHRYPELERIYYQTQDRDLGEGVVNCEAFNASHNCPNGQCLVGALSYYFNRFMEGTSLSTTSDTSPNSSPLMRSYKPAVNLKLSDSDLIRLIVSLVGELHSVSKYGYTIDDNGKTIPISFVDATKKIDTNLFEYWNSVLVQKTIKDRPHFWFSGWTHMNNLSRHIISVEESLWKNSANKTEVFEKWSSDTWRDSCSRSFRTRSKQSIYSRLHMQFRNDQAIMTQPIWPKHITNGETEINFQFKRDYILPTNHVFADFDLIKNKILIAGLRLSLVLNHILTNKDPKKLRTGSAIQLPNVPPVQSGSGIWNDESARNAAVGSSGLLGSSSGWTTNLIINLGIIGVLVLGFIAFLNLTGERTSPSTRARRSGAGGGSGEVKAKD